MVWTSSYTAPWDVAVCFAKGSPSPSAHLCQSWTFNPGWKSWLCLPTCTVLSSLVDFVNSTVNSGSLAWALGFRFAFRHGLSKLTAWNGTSRFKPVGRSPLFLGWGFLCLRAAVQPGNVHKCSRWVAASMNSGCVVSLPVSSPSRFAKFLYQFPKLDRGTLSVSCVVCSAKLTETVISSSSLCD